MRGRVARLLLLGAMLFILDRWRFEPAPIAPAAAAAPEEEMLLHEALARGVDRYDAVVQRRLLDDMAFLEAADESAAGRREEALALGLPRGDVVVRRRLIEAMRLRLSDGVVEPSEEELRRYLAEHASSFALSAQIRLTQIFLRRDDTDSASRAADLLVRLRSAQVSDEDIAELGDPGPWPTRLPAKSPAALAKLFGRALGARLEALPSGEWSGPLESPYGLHLVRVDERTPPQPASFDTVRGRVRAALLAEGRAAHLESALSQRQPARAAGGIGEVR